MNMGSEDAFNSNLNYVDLVNLIRSIQRAEENIDCYPKDRKGCCGRMDGVWREHCFMAPGEQSSYHIGPQAKKELSDPKQDRGSKHKESD